MALSLLTVLFSLFLSTTGWAKQPPMQKLTVALDWFVNPDHAPLIVAKQQGFFKEQGLEVELIGPADPNDPPKWVAAGKADIGLTYQPELLVHVDHGLPLISIGALIDKPLNCLVALKNGSIQSLSDLKGKRIASTSDGLADLMLKMMLEKNGLTMKDVKLVNVHYNLSQALLSRQVDAVTGLQRNVEVPELEANNHKIVAFFPEEYGVPNYYELIFVINKNNINDKRFRKFLAAIQKAVAYLDQHPNETWEQFIKEYPEANNATNKQSWFTTLPYFAENPSMIDHREWKHFANFMKDNHLIKTARSTSEYTVDLTRS